MVQTGAAEQEAVTLAAEPVLSVDLCKIGCMAARLDQLSGQLLCNVQRSISCLERDLDELGGVLALLEHAEQIPERIEDAILQEQERSGEIDLNQLQPVQELYALSERFDRVVDQFDRTDPSKPWWRGLA